MKLFPLPQVRSNNSDSDSDSNRRARTHGPARPVMGSVQYMARPKEGEFTATACDLLGAGAVYADGVAHAAPLPGPTDRAAPR